MICHIEFKNLQKIQALILKHVLCIYAKLYDIFKFKNRHNSGTACIK